MSLLKRFLLIGVLVLSVLLIALLARERPRKTPPPEGALVTVAGADQSPPTAPIDLILTDQTDRTLSLAWSAATDDLGVAEYEIYNGLIRIGTATSTTVTLKGLRPSTTYNLTVKARDAAWNFSAPSNTLRVSTEADTDRTPPSAPTGLRLLTVTDRQARIEWAPAKDNIAVTGYEIYSGSKKLATAGGSQTLLKELAPGTSYTLTIKAKDQAGNLSTPSEPLTFATGAKDTSPPGAPAVLTSPEQSDRSVTLRWQPAADNYAVVAYELYRDGVKVAESASTNYLVSGMGPMTSASYHVIARDAAGNRSPASSPVSATTSQASFEPPGRPVRAYYAQWATYSGFQVADIDATKITHINYAFADIGEDLKVRLGDRWADVEQEFPGDSPAAPFKGNLGQLRKLKQRFPHLKTILSVGGWTWSGKFSDMALSEARRAAFADSVVDLLVRYGFDGVDFDWEYPVEGGMAGNVRRPIDGQNLVALLQVMRQRLDGQGVNDGKRYELSIAGGAAKSYIDATPLAEIAPLLDYVQIMTYDLAGPWDKSTGFNAPLYRVGGQGWSVAQAVEGYLGKGVPASKLVLGLPFYGYEFRAAQGLLKPFAGQGISRPFGELEQGFIGKSDFQRSWHANAQAPYLWNGSTFVSYDDPESIAQKVGYLKAKGLAGAMIWEISQDPSEVLLQRLSSELR